MPSNARDHKPLSEALAAAQDCASGASIIGENEAWDLVLAVRRRARSAALAFPFEVRAGRRRLTVAGETDWRLDGEPSPAARLLIELYLPLALIARRRRFVLGHLGQSLDGRIATTGGASQWLTGEGDLRHTHRLRALADAVIVGATTVRRDDPQLTVRHCPGDQPVRVVLDANLALRDDRRLFRDGAAPSLVLAAADRVGSGARLGAAEIVPVPLASDGFAPSAVVAALAERGLTWLFIEGGGVTVSRFLAAGALDRLQIAVAPVILGSGRPSLQLPEIGDLAAALRPRVRFFALGTDMLVECIFHD